MSDNSKGLAFGVAAVLIWTGFILVSRLGGVSELSAYDVIAIRYLTCTAILLPLWWFRFRFQLLSMKLFITSLVGGLAYALFTFSGFQLAPASHAAILLPGLMPLFIIVSGVLINNEKVASRRWFGLALITSGVIGLFVQQLESDGAFIEGDSYLVAGAFCWAVFSVLIKRWQIPPWQVTVSLAVFTCLIYMPTYVLFLPSRMSIELWPDISLQAFYQGFMATILQMILYVRAVQLIGPSSMGVLMSIVPVLSGLSAIYFFGEDANGGIFFALLLVSLGAAYASGKAPRFGCFYGERGRRTVLVRSQRK